MAPGGDQLQEIRVTVRSVHPRAQAQGSIQRASDRQRTPRSRGDRIQHDMTWATLHLYFAADFSVPFAALIGAVVGI